MGSLHNRVVKYRPDGTFVTKWGKSGPGNGEFLVPSGVAIDVLGDVYVVDWGHQRIEKFGPNGEFLTKWGSRGSGPGQFGNAQGIAVDSRGFVYVTDVANGRVEVFTENGDFKYEVNLYGQGTDRFMTPFAVAVDNSDNVYVTDTSSYTRVVVFTPAGTPLKQWCLHVDGDPYAPHALGITVNHLAEVFVTDANNQCVKKYGRAAPPPDSVPPVSAVRGADKKWRNRPVTLTIVSRDNVGGSGVDYSEVRLQDWLVPFWGPWVNGSTFVVPASASHADDGDRLVQYRSVDLAGNIEKAKQVKVLIDTTAPRVNVQPASGTRNRRVVIKFKVVEQLSPQIRVDAAVLDKQGHVVHSAKSQWLSRKGSSGWSFICRFGPGAYDVRIAAYDLAKNKSDPPGWGTLTVK